MPARALLTAALLAALGAAGCGPGAGAAPEGTKLVVTRDYGERTLLADDAPRAGGSDTVMRLLQRNARVETRYGGKFVQELDGVAGGSRDGRTVDWFFYVNGVFSDEGAASVRVREGDTVWWDHHAWDPGVEPHALVGAFPEPFLNGIDGRRLPVRVECPDVDTAACKRVRDELVGREIPASRGGVARSLTKETLRVLVGPWAQLRGDAAAASLADEPAGSGVFARFTEGGRALQLLDSAGAVKRTLGPGGGLVAATRLEDNQPVWLVTGTDAAGVEAAAGAFREDVLAKRFAVAVDGGRPVPLPDER